MDRRILRFTASWCGPCKTMAQQLEELNLNMPIEVIDIDVFSDVAMDYGIRSVPTLIMMDGNVEVKRKVGVTTKEILKNWIEA